MHCFIQLEHGEASALFGRLDQARIHDGLLLRGERLEHERGAAIPVRAEDGVHSFKSRRCGLDGCAELRKSVRRAFHDRLNFTIDTCVSEIARVRDAPPAHAVVEPDAVVAAVFR